MEFLKELYQTLSKRTRPEDVVKIFSPHLNLSRGERAILNKVEIDFTKSYWGWSFLNNDFYQPVGMDKQLSTANKVSGIDLPSEFNLLGIDKFILSYENYIKVKPGKTDFKFDRLNRQDRKKTGVDISRRQYNKLFRLAARLESKRKKFGTELDKRDFLQIAKSRLANRISYEEFSSDINSACLIAYYTAKCNKRSVFTNQSQERPFDEICEMLLSRCDSNANWNAIAYVYPEQKVINKLTTKQKMDLLSSWFNILNKLSNLLKEVWDRSNINRKTMIVRKGNDSSTWNAMAGAWNKARDGWISLLYNIGAERLLDEFCPGKVLRLMAGDVAYWHATTGGDLEPDTKVWNKVPLPWQVFSGEAICGKENIENICRECGVDPFKSGWIGAKQYGQVNEFKPTPELVHGVIVVSPYLARTFKRLGWFSGKHGYSSVVERPAL